MKKTCYVICSFIILIFLNQNAQGQTPDTLFFDDFESGIGGWHADNGVWQIVQPPPGPSRAYSGKYTPGTVVGGVGPNVTESKWISPPINLPLSKWIRLNFWHWSYTDNTRHEGNVQISVEGSTCGLPWQTISRQLNSNDRVWTQYEIDLSDFAGSVVRIAFRFPAIKLRNDLGWYIDDVSIETFDKPYGQLKNGSFEDAVVNLGNGYRGLTIGSTVMNGWIVTEGVIYYVGGFWNASDGVRSVELRSGSISQTFRTLKDSLYQVSFYMAGNPDAGPSIKKLRVSVPTVREFDFSIAGKTKRDMGWQEIVFKFTAVSHFTTLTFTGMNFSAGTYTGPTIDNIRIVGPTSVQDTRQTVPKSYSLSQNYPNPFNPETNISYYIPKASKINIEIFDVLGRRVKVLVDKYQMAGQYSIKWAGEDERDISVTSGVYFCLLKADGIVVSKRKMVLHR